MKIYEDGLSITKTKLLIWKFTFAIVYGKMESFCSETSMEGTMGQGAGTGVDSQGSANNKNLQMYGGSVTTLEHLLEVV